jgi:leucyl-tRNA---protein transferase
MTPFISQEFTASGVTPIQMDALLATGWRHFGTSFFRYNWQTVGAEWQRVIPLRIGLADFRLSKSQRRVLRQNSDLVCRFQPSAITDEIRDMFQRHKRRFKDNVPNNITDFLSTTPATVPGEGRMLCCHLEQRLVAVSYMDIGSSSVSSIYGIFDPEHSERSLGIFTMLTEIQYAISAGFTFHYPGYATSGPSGYDYKKRFSALEGYDWDQQEWRAFADILGGGDVGGA